MSQQAFQLTQPDHVPEVGLERNARSTDVDARFSEIRALSEVRESTSPFLPLWLESAYLGVVLSLTLVSYSLLNVDLGTRQNLVVTLTTSALSCATIAAGLNRARRASALGVVVMGLAALLLAWFAFAATGDSMEGQPARQTFEETPS